MMRICRHCGRRITKRDDGSWGLESSSLKEREAKVITSLPCYGNPQPCPPCGKCVGTGTVAGEHEPQSG